VLLLTTLLHFFLPACACAICFCRYDIHGWCCLPGAIATWNLARLDSHSDSSGRADRLINVDVCVMCCAFHPGEPVSFQCRTLCRTSTASLLSIDQAACMMHYPQGQE
jgi:hypothetical protein